MKARAPVLSIAALQSLCVFYVLAWCLAPQLAIDAVWRVALAAAFAGWFALEGLRNGFAQLANGTAALVLFFLLYTATVQLITGGPAHVVHNVQMHILLVCALIGIAYRGARLRELEWLALPALAILGAAIGKTLFAIAADPHAARHVVRTSAAALELLRTGVGGYQLVYASALAAPVLLVLLKAGRPRAFFAALTAVWALACSLVLAAGYSIAVFVLLIGSVLALFMPPSRAAPMQLVFVVGAVVVVALALDPLLGMAESLAAGTKYLKKIADLRQSLAIGESVGTASDRMSRYARSLSLFAGSPLVGTLLYAPLGKHSQLLDTFARYGAPIGLVGLFVLVRLPGRLMRTAPGDRSPASLVLQTALALYLTLNNATAAHGAVVYLLLPATAFAAARRRARTRAPPRFAARRSAQPARPGMAR